MRVQESMDIQASPERVWPFLVEPEKILQWYIPLQKFEYTSEQRSGVNAPFYFEENVAGGSMKLNCEITEWVDNEALAFRMISGNMPKRYRERWSVDATPSGSGFTFEEQGEFAPAILDKLIGPLAQRISRSTVEKILVKLKSLVEA